MVKTNFTLGSIDPEEGHVVTKWRKKEQENHCFLLLKTFLSYLFHLKNVTSDTFP